MFQTKKQIEALKSEINSITETVKINTESFNKFSDELSNFNKQTDKNQAVMAEFIRIISENMGALEDIKDNFKKELYDFKLLKSQLQSKLLEKFDEELQKNLLEHNADINTAAKEYDELKKNMMEMSRKISTISNEIDKFNSIAKSIKKEDFEFAKYAQELNRSNSEKLELMRKIDTLERLVSGLRRSK